MRTDGRADLTKLRTAPLAARRHKVEVANLAGTGLPGIAFSDFLNRCLPRIQEGASFRAVVAAIVRSHERRRAVAAGLGAHVLKCGLGPQIIQLMRLGVLTSVALNGGGAVHDFELALVGHTSEDVPDGLATGDFGTAEETASLMNGALRKELDRVGPDFEAGMGQLLGQALIDLKAPYGEYSVLYNAAQLGLPITVHVAIGTDVVHMHGSANGAAIGQATHNDFRRYVAALRNIGHGGTYLNIGSAVILPEVFLKGINVLRNLDHNLTDFTAVDMDMTRHYRPSENVVKRPTTVGGHGYALTGAHELLLPLLVQAIVEEVG